MTETHYQGEIGLLQHKESKEDYVWNPRDFSEVTLNTSMPIIKTHGKLEQLKKGQTTKEKQVRNSGSFLHVKNFNQLRFWLRARET